MNARSAIELSALHTEIKRCRACVDDGFPVKGPPLVSSSDRSVIAPAPFVVIGQAPSLTDHRVGLTYQGSAGQRLMGWLLEAGFRSDQIGSDICLTALTKCFPGRLPGKSSDRAPSPRELGNCHPWLDRELGLLQPRVIILFGKLAIDTFLRPAIPLDRRVGKRFDRGGCPCIPLPHSSGASTWLNSQAHKDLLADAIALVRTERMELQL